MQEREAAIPYKIKAFLELRFRFSREARNQISTKDDIGAQPPRLFGKRYGIGAQMPPLHALQNQIRTVLQGKMQMRHQAGFFRNQPPQVFIHFHGIKR